MSDTGRQSFTDKVSAAVKPDSEKSTTEHFGDKLSGKADNFAGSAQPQGEKSYTQKIGDAFSGDSTGNNNESLVDKAKNAVGLGGSNEKH